MSNKIAVVGMPQSGSTAIFNIVLRLLEHFGEEVYTSIIHPTINRGPDSVKNISASMSPQTIEMYPYQDYKVLLIKEHHYIEEILSQCDKIICVSRNIKEAIVSRLSRGKKLTSKGQIMSGIIWPTDTDEQFKMYCNYLTDDCYQKWQSDKTINIDYESYCDNPHFVLEKISRGIFNKLPENPDEILNRATTYRDDEDWYTLFTDSKINNEKISLTEEMSSYIDKNFSQKFLKEKKELTKKPNRIKTGYQTVVWDQTGPSNHVQQIVTSFIQKMQKTQNMQGDLNCGIYIEFLYIDSVVKINEVKFEHLHFDGNLDKFEFSNKVSIEIFDYFSSANLEEIISITRFPKINDENLKEFTISAFYDLRYQIE